MDNRDDYEYFYRLWEFHSGLLWNWVQYIIVILAGIYTGWFILFQLFMNSDKYNVLYFLLAEFLNIFGVVVCYYFLRLVKRNIAHQEYCEGKLPNVFEGIKNDSIKMETRGRYIFQRLMIICIVSCLVLLVYSVISFGLKLCNLI